MWEDSLPETDKHRPKRLYRLQVFFKYVLSTTIIINTFRQSGGYTPDPIILFCLHIFPFPLDFCFVSNGGGSLLFNYCFRLPFICELCVSAETFCRDVLILSVFLICSP